MPMLKRGSQLLGGWRLAVPVPVYGAELLTDGGLENWATDTNLASWSESIGGTSTVNKDSTNQRGGTYCARLDIDASDTSAAFFQGTPVVGTWYLVTAWAKKTAGAAAKLNLGKVGQGYTSAAALSATYEQRQVVLCATSMQSFLFARGSSSASASIAIDDVSAKPITLASMFSTRPYSTHVTVKAAATVVAGTRAGVVCNLDSASSPANFVLASHDGTTARLTKCVAGTYTELVSTSVAYVAGAAVEIRRPAGGDVWKLYYNGSQVGTDQTISDAAIKAATLAGFFNTFSQNQLSAFSCVPSA